MENVMQNKVPGQFLTTEARAWVRSVAMGLGAVMQSMHPDMDMSHTTGAMMH